MNEEEIEIKIINNEENEEPTEVIYINVESHQMNNNSEEDESQDLEFSLPSGMLRMVNYIVFILYPNDIRVI